jgi:putative transcriptional regulator
MNKANELKAVLRGQVQPGRVWKLSRKSDGTVKRELVNAESYRKTRQEEWDKREAAEARRKLGLSQSEFAQLLGVSVNTLQNWEQGRRKPTGAARVLLRVATGHPKLVLQAA